VSERDELLAVKDAAKYLGGVHRSTVYREHQRGRIRFVKVGGSTFVRRSELDRYLRASERASAA